MKRDYAYYIFISRVFREMVCCIETRQSKGLPRLDWVVDKLGEHKYSYPLEKVEEYLYDARKMLSPIGGIKELNTDLKGPNGEDVYSYLNTYEMWNEISEQVIYVIEEFFLNKTEEEENGKDERFVEQGSELGKDCI